MQDRGQPGAEDREGGHHPVIGPAARHLGMQVFKTDGCQKSNRKKHRQGSHACACNPIAALAYNGGTPECRKRDGQVTQRCLEANDDTGKVFGLAEARKQWCLQEFPREMRQERQN